MDTTTLYIVKAKEYKVKDDDSLDSLAKDAGITWQELAKFNWGTDNPREINRFLKNRVGCSKRTKDGNNYMFSSKDDPGIIYIPQDAPLQQFSANSTHTIKVARPKIYSFISLQTTDVFGLKVANVQLLLKSRDGWPDVNIVTDDKGVGKKDKILSGSYEIFLNSGKPAYFLSNQTKKGANPDMGVTMGQYVPAVINTDFRSEAITRIIVLKGDEEKVMKQRDLVSSTYRQKDNMASLKPEAPGEEDPDSPDDIKSIYDPNVFCADNLLLAAGLDDSGKKIALKKLIDDYLHSFLDDYYPEAIARGYYVLIIDPAAKRMTLYDKKGNAGKGFDIRDDVELSGLFGAYAVLEAVNATLFVDLATQTYEISANFNSATLDTICPEGQKASLIEALNSHGDEVQIVYLVPTAGQLGLLIRKGGTRLLEEYGNNSLTRSTVHERNLAVCRNVKKAYESYIEWYVQQVKKANSEKEIRALKAPDSVFIFPFPGTANDSEKSDLLDANNSTREYKAWAAIAERVDAIHGEIPQGSMFLSLKLDIEKLVEKEYGKTKGVGGVEFKINFFINDRGEIEPTEVETEVKTSVEVEKEFEKDGKVMKAIKNIDPEGEFMKKVRKVTGDKELKGSIGFEVSYDPKTGDTTHKVVPTFGIFSAEITDRGGGKFMIGMHKLAGVVSEASVEDGQMAEGAYINLGDKGKLYIMLGFQGIKADTLLAYFSKAPGFFERRDAEDLQEKELGWSKLHYDEREKLKVLGWTTDTWDGKEGEPPECTTKPYSKLTNEQKIAALHLGIGREEWLEFWKKRAENMKENGKE